MKKIAKKGHSSRHGKRYLAFLMSLCLLGTMIPISARAEGSAGEPGTSGYSKYVNSDICTRAGWEFEMTGQPQTVATVRTINLDPAVLRPKDGTWDMYVNPSSKENQNIVYFGKWRDNSVEYRVLSSPNTQNCTEECLLLDSAYLVKCMAFDTDGVANTGQTAPNAWAGSDLESWLNGEDFYKSESAFSNLERAAIAKTTLSGVDEYRIEFVLGDYQDYPAEDYVFCLSLAEAEGLYAGGCGSANIDKYSFKNEDYSNYYWLRSVGKDSADSEVVCIEKFPTREAEDVVVTDYTTSVSPAFNVKLSSILFASVPDANVKPSDLTPVSESKGVVWKLTLLDDQKTVRVTDGKSVTRADQADGSAEITVPYTYTDENTTNAVTRISVMITDKEYTTKGAQVLYYGKLQGTGVKIEDGGASGMGTFTLPSEYADKSCGRDYYVYLIAEDVNGNTETDYASTPVQIHIPALHTVNVSNGTLSDGNTTGEYAEGDTVTITADTAPAGERFKEWTVESGTVTLADSTGETTTFVMPGEAVSVKAVYEAIPVTEYTITAAAGANGSISPAGAVRVAAGDSRTFTFGADSGYVIDSLKVDGAAVTADGNSYTFNSVDSDHTIEVTFKQQTGSAAVVYQILNGADGSWTAGGGEGLTIRGDGAFSKFIGVKVDGNLLDRSNYTAEEGSTIITLKADYLNTLSVGKHTTEILWTDGSAGTAFTVNAKVSGDVTGTTNNNSTSSNNSSANNNSTSNDNSASNDNSTVSDENTGNAVAPKTGDITQGVWLPVLMLGIDSCRMEREEELEHI